MVIILIYLCMFFTYAKDIHIPLRALRFIACTRQPWQAMTVIFKVISIFLIFISSAYLNSLK